MLGNNVDIYSLALNIFNQTFYLIPKLCSLLQELLKTNYFKEHKCLK